MLGHRPRRPVRGIRRRGLQRRGDQRLDLLVADHPRPARPRLVEQPVEPLLDEPVAPLRIVARVKPSRAASSVLVPPSAAANTIRARIANPAALVRRRAHPPTRPFVIGQHDLVASGPSRHNPA